MRVQNNLAHPANRFFHITNRLMRRNQSNPGEKRFFPARPTQDSTLYSTFIQFCRMKCRKKPYTVVLNCKVPQFYSQPFRISTFVSTLLSLCRMVCRNFDILHLHTCSLSKYFYTLFDKKLNQSNEVSKTL